MEQTAKQPGKAMRPESNRHKAGRAWLAAIALGLASLVLFCINIGQPTGLYFDEVHYVPAARALIEQSGPVNIEHPLLSKTLIAAGILLFGDNALGWRLPSAICGAIAVMALFWIALRLFRDIRIAGMTALLLVFNQTHFIQSRIAMLEMPMTALLLLALGCFLQSRDVSASKSRQWEMTGAVALGLAIGAKWLAIPYVALFLAGSAVMKWQDAERDNAQLLDRIVPETLKLGLIAGLTYLATFWPAFFYRNEPMTLRHLLGFQFEMLNAQRGHMAAHPYQSAWWQWPLMLRPIWYLFEKAGEVYRAVLLVGNPVIYWGGLAAALLPLGGWLKIRDGRLWAAIGLYAFSLAIWILIPKQVEFFYYYNLSAVWLCLVISAFFAAFGLRGRRWLEWFTLLSALAFFYFYPIISAQPLPTDDSWTSWVWMKSWF
jgi:dolichyl-phosphate-mannose--protein O-mannosyl transferase